MFLDGNASLKHRSDKPEGPVHLEKQIKLYFPMNGILLLKTILPALMTLTILTAFLQ
jgi:hypothetical protein